MRKKIEAYFRGFVSDYARMNETITNWESPIIGFADASDELFLKLKTIVGNQHKLPREFLLNAETVISYFIPFERNIIISNKGNEASRQWAIAYVETNNLINDLNKNVSLFLEKKTNNDSHNLPPTYNFDEEKLISDWSHRHVAFIAGVGKFGLNKMIITEKGCCGRLGSLITSLKMPATERTKKEYCLYYHDKSCKICIENCKWNALTVENFDRHACYDICLKNAEKFSDIGIADACGKCLCMTPCSFQNPVK